MTDSPSDLRQRLAHAREETLSLLAAVERDHAGVVEASADSNADDEHDPEGQTIAFERSQLAAVRDGARRRLHDIEAALAEVEEGSYGTCERCGEQIDVRRLQARPTARACLRCAALSRG